MSHPELIAHYRLTTKLGEGGMGAVYRATDTKLNRDVAIKILPDAFANDRDRMARFTREAQVLASLNHPNIAAIYGTPASRSRLRFENHDSDPFGVPISRPSRKHRDADTELVTERPDGADRTPLPILGTNRSSADGPAQQQFQTERVVHAFHQISGHSGVFAGAPADWAHFHIGMIGVCVAYL